MKLVYIKRQPTTIHGAHDNSPYICPICGKKEGVHEWVFDKYLEHDGTVYVMCSSITNDTCGVDLWENESVIPARLLPYVYKMRLRRALIILSDRFKA